MVLVSTTESGSRPVLGEYWLCRFVMTFWFVSFVAWVPAHAIYRYIIPLELLSGAMIVFVLCATLPDRARMPAVIIVAGAVVLTTRYPDWWRVPFRQHFFEIAAPQLPDDAMVLIVENTPVAYLIPFLDPKIRFVGAMNNINAPWRTNLLAQQVKATITRHNGPLFSLESSSGSGDEGLAAYGLKRQRDKCMPIRTNVAAGPIEICPLVKSANE